MWCLLLLVYRGRYAARPEQWRSKQQSEQSTYKEFYSTFGSGESKLFKKNNFLTNFSNQTSNPNAIKNIRKEIDDRLDSGASSIGKSGSKRQPGNLERHGEKYAKHELGDDISKGKDKKLKKRKKRTPENIDASKEEKSAVKPFLSYETTSKKRHGKDKASKSSKKLKA